MFLQETPEQTDIINFIPTVLIFIAVLIILFYIYLGIRDLVVLLNNFNLKRAEYCRLDSCKFYFVHKETNSHECLNPFISILKFEKLRKLGNSPGCKKSVCCSSDRSQQDFLAYYLELYQSFNANHLWWKIISIIVGIALIQLGVMSLYDVISIIF